MRKHLLPVVLMGFTLLTGCAGLSQRNPSSGDKARRALASVACVRDDERLRVFLEDYPTALMWLETKLNVMRRLSKTVAEGQVWLTDVQRAEYLDTMDVMERVRTCLLAGATQGVESTEATNL